MVSPKKHRVGGASRITPILLGTIGVFAFLTACGDSDDTTSTTTSTQSSSASTTGAGGMSGAGGGVTSASTGGSSASGGTSGTGGNLVGDLSDDFDGDGTLLGYTTNNPNSLPDVMRVGGRYRANLIDNANDITLHFNDDQGRLDAKLVAFPFEVVVRNIGIGTQADSQVAPAASGSLYVFAGVQVHVPDLNSRNSSHVVVGHRGNQYFTVEGKNTVNGNSSVNDVGGLVVPDGRADIRIVGNPDHSLSVSWQTPNPAPGMQADAWTPYNGTGTLPGQAPSYGNTVYVGLITYAFGNNGVPFVGTADAIEGGTQ